MVASMAVSMAEPMAALKVLRMADLLAPERVVLMVA